MKMVVFHLSIVAAVLFVSVIGYAVDLRSHYGSQSLARNLALTTNAIVDEAGSAFDAAPSASQKQISVCRCDSVGTCDSDHLMTKQDELFLCVTATDNTTINNVQSLEFRQDGVSQSTITDGKSGEYTWVVKNGRSCMIRTRVKQEFFKPSFRAAKRTSLAVRGTVVLFQENVDARFELTLRLHSSPLTSYISGHEMVIFFFFLLMLLICLLAVCITMASLSRTRPETKLTPEELLEVEKKRSIAIYTIWQQSKWGKTYLDEAADRTCVDTSARVHLSADTWSSSSSEEEKTEVRLYEEETAIHTPSVYAANLV